MRLIVASALMTVVFWVTTDAQGPGGWGSPHGGPGGWGPPPGGPGGYGPPPGGPGGYGPPPGGPGGYGPPPGGPGGYGPPHGGPGGYGPPPGGPGGWGPGGPPHGGPGGPYAAGGNHTHPLAAVLPECKDFFDAMGKKMWENLKTKGPPTCPGNNRADCMKTGMTNLRCSVTEKPTPECLQQMTDFMSGNLPCDEPATDNPEEP